MKVSTDWLSLSGQLGGHRACVWPDGDIVIFISGRDGSGSIHTNIDELQVLLSHAIAFKSCEPSERRES